MRQVIAIVVVLGSSACAFVNAARADSFLVAPNTLATTEGNASGSVGPNTTFQIQEIFDASQFSGTGPIDITALLTRPDKNNTFNLQEYSSYQVTLSTTTQTVSGLSSTFASNVGADAKVVFDGPLTLTTANTPLAGGTGGVKQFDLVTTLSIPFLYNPANGNLLLDIQATTGTNSGLSFDFDSSSTINSVFTNIGTSFGAILHEGAVEDFEYQTPLATPEPATLTLLGTGFLTFGGYRLSRRRRA
jgi:PEP-CTERM motif